MAETDLSILKRGAHHESDGLAPKGGRVNPPPRRPWTTRILIPGVILAGAIGLLAFAARGALRPAHSVQIMPVIARSGVQQSVGTAVVQAPGWVEPDPFPISVTTLADGVVQEVLVLEGEPVRKGQTVARLVPDDARLALDRAEAELRERQAALKTAQALAQEAQRNWDHPIELQRKLKTAQAMLAEKQAELTRWPAEVEAEKARLAELQDAFARVKRVRAESQGALSEQELVKAQKMLEAQKAVVTSTEFRQPIIEAQIRNLQAQVKAAEEDLELRITDTRALKEAQANLAQAEAAVQRAQAMRDEAQLRLDRMEIRSPIDGVVMTRLIQPGSKLMLNADMPTAAQVARLYDPAKLQVRVDVPLADAAQVGVGQAAEVVVSALPERTFTGRVTHVVHEADIQKNTLQFKVAIQDPVGEIKPEMLARVRFLAQVTSRPAEASALFVPSRLVREDGGQSVVWLFDQTRQVAELRKISLGTARLQDWVEVREGLRQGDWLISDPPADLRPGAAVRAVGEAGSGHENHGGQS